MLETTPYDTADMLRTKTAMAAYLEAALETGDMELMLYALDTVARAERRVSGEDNPRRAYGPGDTPEDLAALFRAELERLAGGQVDESGPED